MLAFTMQFSKHGQNQPPATTKPPTPQETNPIETVDAV
jgi:hypothetical protein